MAYRATEKTEARKAAVRARLLQAALAQVARAGFGALTVAELAQQADMATGAVYKHFDSKAALCAEVFRLATENELAVVRRAALAEGAPTHRLHQAIARFAARALRAPRLAYALIAEPVDTLVDDERLRYRHAYAEIYQQLVEDGMRSGAFVAQDSAISAAALVGLIAEALVGPLSWQRGVLTGAEQAQLIGAIQALSLRAVGAAPAQAT